MMMGGLREEKGSRGGTGQPLVGCPRWAPPRPGGREGGGDWGGLTAAWAAGSPRCTLLPPRREGSERFFPSPGRGNRVPRWFAWSRCLPGSEACGISHPLRLFICCPHTRTLPALALVALGLLSLPLGLRLTTGQESEAGRLPRLVQLFRPVSGVDGE